jgi:hypothetical protein
MIFLVTFLLVSLSSLLPSHSHTLLAQSPSASPSATPTKSSKLEDIQKIRETVQQKVQEKIKEITTPSSIKKGFIGKVIELDSESITLDYQNSSRKILVDSDTVYIDTKRNKSSLDKVKIGQDLLAMGYLDEEGTLTAKRIVFIDLKSITEKKYLVIAAKIVDISKSSPVIVVVPFVDKDTQYQLKTDSKTEFVSPEGLKIKSDNLATGHKVIAIFPTSQSSTKTYPLTKIIDFDLASPAASPTAKPTP